MAAYLIVDVGPVHDESVYAAYRSRVPASLAAAGGRYLARGGAVEVLEGDWSPDRVIVVRFETPEGARRWWSSAEYAELKDMRRASTTTRMIVVDGVRDGETS
jgi:uncharacterized protein (DUF1330 family)